MKTKGADKGKGATDTQDQTGEGAAPPETNAPAPADAANAPSVSDQAAASDSADVQAPRLTAQDCAEIVVEHMPVLDDEGNPTGKTRKVHPLKASDVLSWKLYDDRLVVVSTAGKKYTVEKPADAG